MKRDVDLLLIFIHSLKTHISDCFKDIGKQMIKMPTNGEHVIFKNYEKSKVAICDTLKQNLSEPYTNKYQKHVPCSYDYKLVCVDGKFGKSFNSYLGKDAGKSFINSIIKEITFRSDVMKNTLTKKLMTKKGDEDFESSTEYFICDNV